MKECKAVLLLLAAAVAPNIVGAPKSHIALHQIDSV